MVHRTSVDDVLHHLGIATDPSRGHQDLPREDVTRLEIHRKALEEEQRHGPLLRIEDLNSDEISLINASFLDLCRRRRVSDIDETYSAYVDTLHQWGVMCPHPQVHRLYDGRTASDFPKDFETSRWFDCTLCGSAVVNR